MKNQLTLIKVLLFGLLISNINSKVGSYDLKDVKSAWEDPITKNIIQEIKKFDISRQSVEAIQTLEKLNDSFQNIEKTLIKKVNEIQGKCDKQREEGQSILEMINVEYAKQNVQICSGKQIQAQMKQDYQIYKQMINQNQKLVLEINEEIEQLEATMWYKLKQNEQASQNIQQLIQIMLQITESPYQSPKFKDLLSQFVKLQQTMAKDDPMRLMSEAFSRVLLQFDMQVVRKVVQILKNIQANNKSEQIYLVQSKEFMMENLNNQKDLILNTNKTLECNIQEIQESLNDFQKQYEDDDLFGDGQNKELQEKLNKQEKVNQQGESKCLQELRNFQIQVDNNKRKMQLIQTLIKYINHNSEQVQKFISQLK